MLETWWWHHLVGPCCWFGVHIGRKKWNGILVWIDGHWLLLANQILPIVVQQSPKRRCWGPLRTTGKA